MNSDRPRRLHRDGHNTLAYHKSSGISPGVVFLSGYQSDMSGTKAVALGAACKAQTRAYVRFDYSGHGESSGDFEDCVVSDWLADAVAVLDQCTDGPQVLVGSSMGGWIALLTALARPDRVAGLVGIAAAPDFTEDLLLAKATDAERETFERDGVWRKPYGDGDGEFIVTKALIEDGRQHLMLSEPIPIPVPVRLIHGTGDDVVPLETSQRLMEALTSTEVKFTQVGGAGHRMSEPHELDIVLATVEGLCRSLEPQTSDANPAR
jgi:pimeloyl-ACP methyl ester carboxylesterase